MELFRLHGTIDVDNTSANQALDETSNKGQQTQSKLSKFFSGMGKGAVMVGKTVATGLAVGGTAMGTLTVKAMNLGGELEQNMGGSEAVFKEHAGKMQETAKSAFSNMGLSTSDYLATANKMGALFQGAGFDIEESMTLSSDAMQRAADVASIMGIDTESAMEAIAGAAKGNFTMMDNLGVAMNDTTLQAYALSKGIDKSTSEMTNQEKIGLAMEMFMEKTAYAAGNYAKENETLAGSLGTAKAALTNFLDGSGDVESLVTSFGNFANVVVKNLGELAPRLISGITEIINQIIPMLPPLMQKILPVLIQGAMSLINGLVAAFPSIVIAIMNVLPVLIEAMVSLITTLVGNIATILQPILMALPEIITTIVNALLENLPALIDGCVQLVVMLVAALPEITMALIQAMPQIIVNVVKALLGALPVLLGGVGKILMAVIDGVTEFMSNLIMFLVNGFMKIIEVVTPILTKFGEVIKKAWNKIKETVSKAVEALKNAISKAWNAIKNTASNLWNGIKDAISNVWNGIKNAVSNAVNGVKNTVSNVFNAIKSTATNIWNGIKSAIQKPIEKARDLVKGAIEKIKGFFSFKISWPKIPMPHFGISPSGWKIGDLLKGSIPKLGIEWYAKAMQKPMIMTKPTVFGYDAATGNLMGGGDAGSEVVSGTSTLMRMIQGAVSANNEVVVYYLAKIVEILADYFPQILDGFQHMQIVTDDGTVIAYYAPLFDKALGKIKERKDRGR